MGSRSQQQIKPTLLEQHMKYWRWLSRREMAVLAKHLDLELCHVVTMQGI